MALLYVYIFKIFTDIQECYEVTLQLNATENAAKENGPKELLEVSVLKISITSNKHLCVIFQIHTVYNT